MICESIQRSYLISWLSSFTFVYFFLHICDGYTQPYSRLFTLKHCGRAVRIYVCSPSRGNEIGSGSRNKNSKTTSKRCYDTTQIPLDWCCTKYTHTDLAIISRYLARDLIYLTRRWWGHSITWFRYDKQNKKNHCLWCRGGLLLDQENIP